MYQFPIVILQLFGQLINQRPEWISSYILFDHVILHLLFKRGRRALAWVATTITAWASGTGGGGTTMCWVVVWAAVSISESIPIHELGSSGHRIKWQCESQRIWYLTLENIRIFSHLTIQSCTNHLVDTILSKSTKSLQSNIRYIRESPRATVFVSRKWRFSGLFFFNIDGGFAAEMLKR